MLLITVHRTYPLAKINLDQDDPVCLKCDLSVIGNLVLSSKRRVKGGLLCCMSILLEVRFVSSWLIRGPMVSELMIKYPTAHTVSHSQYTPSAAHSKPYCYLRNGQQEL